MVRIGLLGLLGYFICTMLGDPVNLYTADHDFIQWLKLTDQQIDGQLNGLLGTDC